MGKFIFGPDDLTAEEIYKLPKGKKRKYLKGLGTPKLKEYLRQINLIKK